MHISVAQISVWDAVGRITIGLGFWGIKTTVEISILSIAIVTGLGLLTWRLSFNRRTLSSRGADSAAADDGETQFRTLAEAIPQIVWTAGPDGLTNYINQRWYEMTGMPRHEGLGTGWMAVVHPDDREPCQKKWQECSRSGKTFEVEYRLCSASTGYRWFLDRAVPLKDASGGVKQWFGTCTDIDDQMRNQQLLEEEIKKRASELFEMNTKLQEEMWEKDLARKQLDEQNERMMRDLTDRSTRATMLAKMGEMLQSCVRCAPNNRRARKNISPFRQRRIGNVPAH